MMSIESLFTAEQQQSLARLRTLHRGELRTLFQSLKPPLTSQLVGEYDAELLDQGGRTANFITRIAFSLHGPWTGKAFAPITDSEGIGYNCFRYGQRTVGKLPLRTQLGPSQHDAGESLFIRYHDLNQGIIRWLVGELRQVDQSTILGFGTFRPKIGKLNLLSRQIPFVMVGPKREYMVRSARVRLSDLSRIA